MPVDFLVDSELAECLPLLVPEPYDVGVGRGMWSCLAQDRRGWVLCARVGVEQLRRSRVSSSDVRI